MLVLNTSIPERQPSCAGVLPFFRHGSEIYFLLGKEDFVQGWSASNQWSAFEGKRKWQESTQKAAARELFEETAGVIRLQSEDLAKFALQIYVRSGSHVRLIYVKELLINFNVLVRIRETRACLARIRYLSDIVSEIEEQFNFVYPFMKEDFLIEKDGEKMCVDQIHDVSLMKGILTIVFFTSNGRSFKCKRKFTQSCKIYVIWFQNRKKLIEATLSMNHVALARKFSKTGVSLGCYVNTDFLEKSDFALWTLEQLESRLKNNPSQFRLITQPVLDVILQEFKKQTFS